MTAYRAQDWAIRPATPADVEALVTMRRRLQNHMVHANPALLPMSAQGRTALPTQYREAIAEATAHVVVVQARGTAALVGMAVGRIVVHEALVPSHLGRIDDVWVEPPYRRQGICRSLVQQLVVFFERRTTYARACDWSQWTPRLGPGTFSDH